MATRYQRGRASITGFWVEVTGNHVNRAAVSRLVEQIRFAAMFLCGVERVEAIGHSLRYLSSPIKLGL